MAPMRVLISGGGIAGPTLAWYLARAGARVTVLEKSHSVQSQGQNIDITGSAITLIRNMGLLDEVKKFNTTEKGTQLINSKGEAFARFPLKEGENNGSATSEYEILRGDFAALLHNATKDHPNVDYMFGTTVKQVISNDDNGVMVELSNDSAMREYDLLVLADGQWSKLRKQTFPEDSVKSVDLGMYAVYWTIPRIPSDNDWWNIYVALGARIFTLRPDPHGTTRAMFTRMPTNAAQKKAWQDAVRADRKTQEDLLKSEFADAGWQAQRLLDSMHEASDFYFQPMQQIKMDKWSNNRIICLGDTAFAPTPLTGAGTSLAIMGAYVLAGELSKLQAGQHPSTALDAYEKAYRPWVDGVQKGHIVPDYFHPQTAWKRSLLHGAVWTLDKIVRVPFIMNRFSKPNDPDYPLPQYEAFFAEERSKPAEIEVH